MAGLRIAGILSALDYGGIGEIYNLGTGIGTSNLDIVRMLESHAEMSNMPVRTKILPERSFDVEANILDSSKLRNRCGWVPVISLQTGLQKMWEVSQ